MDYGWNTIHKQKSCVAIFKKKRKLQLTKDHLAFSVDPFVSRLPYFWPTRNWRREEENSGPEFVPEKRLKHTEKQKFSRCCVAIRHLKKKNQESYSLPFGLSAAFLETFTAQTRCGRRSQSHSKTSKRWSRGQGATTWQQSLASLELWQKKS